MKGEPIKQVEARENGILCIIFDTDNSALVDMKPFFQGFRFGILKNPQVWKTADTDGGFVHWYKDGIVVAELSYSEIMKMMLGNSY